MSLEAQLVHTVLPLKEQILDRGRILIDWLNPGGNEDVPEIVEDPLLNHRGPTIGPRGF